jgi:hypothetical protein
MSKTRKLRKARIREQLLRKNIDDCELKNTRYEQQLSSAEHELAGKLDRIRRLDKLLVELFGENSIFFPPKRKIVRADQLNYGFRELTVYASAFEITDDLMRYGSITDVFTETVDYMEVFLLRLRDSGAVNKLKMTHLIVSDSSGHEYGYAVSRTELLSGYGMSALSEVSHYLADYIKEETIRQLASAGTSHHDQLAKSAIMGHP